MPRVSSAPEDAFHFQGTYQDGWGEVIDCKAVVFQFQPMKEAKGNRPAGFQSPPALFAELTIQRHLDGDGNRAADQPEQVLLSIQSPDKATGLLETCRPGRFPDGDTDVDPADMGDELGAEGDTLFAVQDGYRINENTKWMRFCKSLEERGFKPAVLKRTYFPDLIGLRAYFTTLQNEKRAGDDFDSTRFVVKEIRQFPYEKAAAAAKAPVAKGKAPAKAAAAGATGPAPAAAPAGSDASDADTLAEAIIANTVVPSLKGKTIADGKKLRMQCLMGMGTHKPPVPQGQKKAVMDLLTEEYCIAMAQVYGAVPTEAGGFEFPA